MYERMPFNKTDPIHNTGNVLTGSKDAIYIRNKYQLIIDNDYAAIANQTHYVEEIYADIKKLYHKSQALHKEVLYHTNERTDLYQQLYLLLTTETDFESSMWAKTTQAVRPNTINIKQKFNDSDVDEVKFDSMMQYLKTYPEYASKSTFKQLLNSIILKETELRKSKEQYANIITTHNEYLSTLSKEINKAKDKFTEYSQQYKEGLQRLATCGYTTSIFYQLTTQYNKDKCKLDTSEHRILQFTNTLNAIEQEYNSYNKTTLSDLIIEI